MILSILLIIIGSLLIVFNKESTDIIIYTMAGTLVVGGLTLCILTLTSKQKIFFMEFLALGVLGLLFGIAIALEPEILKTVISIITGTWLIINALFKLKVSIVLKAFKDNTWVLTTFLAFISAFAGVILMINPDIASITMTTLLGMLLIVGSATDLTNLIIFKNKVNTIVQYFN